MTTDLNDETNAELLTSQARARTLAVALKVSNNFIAHVRKLIALDEEMLDAEIIVTLRPHAPDEVKH